MRTLRLLGWNPMSLATRRHTPVSMEIKNIDIGIFVGTSIRRIEPQGDFFLDNSHLHYSFGFAKQSTNRTTGISFFLRKSRFSQHKVISLQSPSPEDDICGRLALMRYKRKGGFRVVRLLLSSEAIESL